MSIKRQLQFQYRHFIQAIYTWQLPRWLTCPATRLLLLLTVVIFGSAYIVKTASSAAGGYKIYDLENEISFLESDIKKLEVEIADNSSLYNIQKRLSNVSMVAVGKITYFDAMDKAMAKR